MSALWFLIGTRRSPWPRGTQLRRCGARHDVHNRGTAVGYKKKKKGSHIYDPLFCTVARTGRLGAPRRPGNAVIPAALASSNTLSRQRHNLKTAN